MDKFIYTPGPTKVRESVRYEKFKEATNPDIDLEFVEFYKSTTEKLAKILNTKNEVYILSGEGILGLEAACASLTEQGDRVLVLDNGIFGNGFGDFVSIYGGNPIYFKAEYNEAINIERLKEFLEKDSDFKYATIVHCDTPTGVLNNLREICPLLKSYGIITVVDTVSAMAGEFIDVDNWEIDIALGGSQKALSASPGLTIVSVSDLVKEVMKSRRESIKSFYCNLRIWENYYKDKWFPYTMPINEIVELNKAVDNILDEGIDVVLKRHEKIANAMRIALREYGLELYLKNGYSNTVTAIKIPEKIGALNLKKHLKENYNSLFSTSLGEFENKLIRLGHMGENAREYESKKALTLLDSSLFDLGFQGKCNLTETFFNNL